MLLPNLRCLSGAFAIGRRGAGFPVPQIGHSIQTDSSAVLAERGWSQHRSQIPPRSLER